MVCPSPHNKSVSHLRSDLEFSGTCWSVFPSWDAPRQAWKLHAKLFKKCRETLLWRQCCFFCLYFNMDLEDILQILPRGKKIAFSGEKFRLKYCSACGGISLCWASCEGLCNLAWEALGWSKEVLQYQQLFAAFRERRHSKRLLSVRNNAPSTHGIALEELLGVWGCFCWRMSASSQHRVICFQSRLN